MTSTNSVASTSVANTYRSAVQPVATAKTASAGSAAQAAKDSVILSQQALAAYAASALGTMGTGTSADPLAALLGTNTGAATAASRDPVLQAQASMLEIEQGMFSGDSGSDSASASDSLAATLDQYSQGIAAQDARMIQTALARMSGPSSAASVAATTAG